MKQKFVVKITVDWLLTLALLFVMGYQFWGEAPHEWIGSGMFLLFILYHILNGHWHKNLLKRRYNTLRIVSLVIDLLLFISMLVQIYSSLVMSRYVFAFLPSFGNMLLARRLHILGAYWGFLFMSLHLGLHWNLFLGMIRKAAKINNHAKMNNIVLFTAALSIAGYGVRVFIHRDFLTYLLLKTEFVFLDYSASKILFYIDYLALMGLCIFVAHYGIKMVQKLNKQVRKCNQASRSI